MLIQIIRTFNLLLRIKGSTFHLRPNSFNTNIFLLKLHTDGCVILLIVGDYILLHLLNLDDYNVPFLAASLAKFLYNYQMPFFSTSLKLSVKVVSVHGIIFIHGEYGTICHDNHNVFHVLGGLCIFQNAQRN